MPRLSFKTLKKPKRREQQMILIIILSKHFRRNTMNVACEHSLNNNFYCISLRYLIHFIKKISFYC